MTIEALVTAAVIVGILVTLVFEVASPSVLVFGGVVALLLAGIIEPSEAFAGFSNSAPITVAALFVVARAVSKTGALRPATSRVMGVTGHTRRPMLRMLIPVTLLSGFINNIPLVAMMIPEVSNGARRRGSDAARFLLPLSYGAILGGTLTLIGTSTNLVVAGQMDQVGLEPFSFFELGRVGFPIALLGVITLVATSPKLLKTRMSPSATLERESKDFTMEMEVMADGPIDGMTVAEAKLRHLEGVFLVSVDRGDTTIAPARPNTVLRGGNLLLFAGRVDQVLDLRSRPGLRLVEQGHVRDLEHQASRYFIAAIGGDSPLVGRTLRDLSFRAEYQAAVIAIHRSGQRLAGKLGDARIRVGDALMLLADPEFKGRWENRTDFLIISEVDQELTPPAPGGAVTVIVVAAMIVAAATGLVPVLHAALAAAFALMFLGIITPNEARRAVDLEVIGVIASAFGIAAAMASSGLASTLADGIVAGFAWIGPTGVLLGVVLATIGLTELVTNNAAALLMFPVAIAAASSAAIDPRGMAAAVAICASASFLTPIGYQTNTMVYGPGGYRVLDYLKGGAVLTVLVAIGVTWLIPAVYGV
jgi:di/tricarboxylate transporter